VVGAGVAREKGLWRLRFLNRFMEDLVLEGLEGFAEGVTLLVVALLIFRLRKKEVFLVRLRGRKVVGAWLEGLGSEDFSKFWISLGVGGIGGSLFGKGAGDEAPFLLLARLARKLGREEGEGVVFSSRAKFSRFS